MVKSVRKRRLLLSENEGISYSKCRVIMERCLEAEVPASSLESPRNDETKDLPISRGMIHIQYVLNVDCRLQRNGMAI